MDHDFWRDRWREHRLGWHQPAVHPMLVRHIQALGLEPGARVFVPLCGKTLDIGWLLGSGFRVAGAELVETAVKDLFAELGLAPRIERSGDVSVYRAEGIDIVVGDIFALDRETLGDVDAVWDRAALVALPKDVRPAYVAHVAKITARAPQLLVTFDYDQSQMDGPPFSVGEGEVRALYAGAYEVRLLESAAVEDGLKGSCAAVEIFWQLKTG